MQIKLNKKTVPTARNNFFFLSSGGLKSAEKVANENDFCQGLHFFFFLVCCGIKAYIGESSIKEDRRGLANKEYKRQEK